MPFLLSPCFLCPHPSPPPPKKILWLRVNALRRPDWLRIPYLHSEGEKLYVPQLLRGRRTEKLLRLQILLNSSPPSPRGAIFTVFPLSPYSPSRETGSGEACGAQARSPCSPPSLSVLQGQGSHACRAPCGRKPLQGGTELPPFV